MDRKRPGFGSFLKCVVRNVTLSIDAHFIVVAHYYSFVCYRNSSFIRTVEWENVSVFIKTLRPPCSYSAKGPATFWFVKNILFTMCTAAVHLVLQFCNWRIEVSIIFLINLAWDYPHNEILVTFLLRNRTYGHDILRVQFLVLNFCTQGFLWVFRGVASLLENWILEGDEQGDFPVNAFDFLSIVFRLFFLVQSYE